MIFFEVFFSISDRSNYLVFSSIAPFFICVSSTSAYLYFPEEFCDFSSYT